MFTKSFIIEDRFIYQTWSVALTLKIEHYLRGKIKHCNYWICVYETIQYTRIENSVKLNVIISVSIQCRVCTKCLCIINHSTSDVFGMHSFRRNLWLN